MNIISLLYLSKLFPRENLVGGTKQLPNFLEILSPTLQTTVDGCGNGRSDGKVDKSGGAGVGGCIFGRWNGSYHCELNRTKRRCSFCNHMRKTSTITSPYFGTRFAIHEKNIHMPASQKKKLTLFVNVVQDNVCGLIYVGNIVDVCSRWAQTKKACLNENSVKVFFSVKLLLLL